MQKEIEKIIRIGLDEDLGVNWAHGDITSNLTIKNNAESSFQIATRENITLCGAKIAQQVFLELQKKFPQNTNITINLCAKDGDHLKKNSIIIKGFGNTKLILAGERLALNLLQHLSGIATKTAKYVVALNNSNVKILDTRKTLPGLRALQKYAVKCGKGKNHRFALFDGILIKDNHVAACGGIKNCLDLARKNNGKLDVEIECDNLEQVAQAAQNNADIIMLDNMTLEQIAKSIEIINKKAKIEVSGNINLEKIKDLSKLDIDFISIGALTHSVKAADIGLDFL